MTEKPKRPRDPNQLAKAIVDLAIGDPATEVLREGSSGAAKAKGAKARTRALNPEQRSEIASIAATARWRKRGD